MRNGRGMTLLEVLLALAIFGIAVVGIIEATAYQTRTVRLAEDVTRATMLAEDLLAEIRTVTLLAEDSGTGSFTGANTGFDWRYEISETEIEGLSKVSVTVSWKDGVAAREHRLETYWARQ